MGSYANFNRALAKRYDDWMIALHYTESTRRYAQRVLLRFRNFLARRSISHVTHLEVRDFLTHISAYGATLETAYRHLGVLRRFYDFLNLGGVVSYVPPRLVRMKRIKTTHLRTLSESEIKRLLAATRTKREEFRRPRVFRESVRLGWQLGLTMGGASQADLIARSEKISAESS
jgi:site-specific recombinase XerD